MKRFYIFIDGKLIRDFIAWTICIYLHKNLSDFVYLKGLEIRLSASRPLYDLIQKNIPNLQAYRTIPEILHLIPILLFLYLVIYHSNTNSVLALRKFLRLHAALMLLRGICFSSTLLPDSSQMCLFSKHIGSCFDLIFSGHSTAILLSTYVIIDYFKIGKILKYILHINNFITCFLIIACRNHYTIDVIVSILATNYFYYLDSNKPFLFRGNTYPLYM